MLEVAKLPAPVMVNGVQQKPLEGVSMAYSFNDADAAERHETQYFEMFGNRGIYHKGWTAVTKHRTPWETGYDAVVPAFDDDVWELYDTNTDWSQAHDLAKEHPGKLAELQRLWLIEAVKYNVVPLDDRFVERGLPETAGRPTLIKGKRQLLFGGMGRLTENSVVMMKNTSFSITADITVKGGEPPEGVLLAQGGVSGGHTPLRQGRQAEVLLQLLRPRALLRRGHRSRSPKATTRCAWSSPTTVAASAKVARPTLYIDGVAVGDGRIEQTEAFLFSADETCDVGDEFGSPVTDRLLGEEVHRRGQLGRARPRPRRPQPPDQTRGPPPRRHGHPIAALRIRRATTKPRSDDVARVQRHQRQVAVAGMDPSSVPLTVATTDSEGADVMESNRNVQEGDVIEFTLRGERRTAEAMLITEDDLVLLDLFDGDRPAWARLSILDEVAVFRPEANYVITAA